MEPKKEIDDLLKSHLLPPELELPLLRPGTRQLVMARQKATSPDQDLLMRLAFFLNQRLKLRHAAVALLVITGIVFLSRNPGLSRNESQEDVSSTTFYANSSVSSNTVLSSICTSRVTKNPYDGNNRN